MCFNFNFNQLPPSLEMQLSLSLKRQVIECSPLCKNCAPITVVAVIRRLRSCIALPNDIIVEQVGDPPLPTHTTLALTTPLRRAPSATACTL